MKLVFRFRYGIISKTYLERISFTYFFLSNLNLKYADNVYWILVCLDMILFHDLEFEAASALLLTRFNLLDSEVKTCQQESLN